MPERLDNEEKELVAILATWVQHHTTERHEPVSRAIVPHVLNIVSRISAGTDPESAIVDILEYWESQDQYRPDDGWHYAPWIKTLTEQVEDVTGRPLPRRERTT